ncbi:hypothetical protein Q7A53_10975 [Halobacillus rhizosphaerae]|uniref:hypothetical protein n=1 Tax=Halobacillus rhizosphaerae TaxID=3064889 RepID=UPI00398A5C28
MNLFRKINKFLAIGILCAVFYHFFIHPIDLSINYLLACIFLLFGVEMVIEKERDKKLGYAYLFTSLILISVILVDIFKNVY